MTEIDSLFISTGIDIPNEDFGLTFHQPRIKEIALLGETNYFLALQVFRLNTDTLKIHNPNATDWDVFQKVLSGKVEGITNMRALISNFLQLFLVDKVNIGPRSLIIDSSNGIINIEPEQFREFQNLIRQIGGASLLSEKKDDDFNPKNKRAAEIAEKMKKARAKLAKVKATEMGIDKSKNPGFLARYMKIAEIGTANSIDNINNMTLLQLNNLVQAYFAWESYDLDVRSRLAGAKNEKKMVHWSMADEIRENNFDTI